MTARHTLGVFDCWCQGDICTIDSTGQWWPGKEQGFPHPREKDEMSTEILERVDRSDVKLFGKVIQDLLLALVNECGIRYRMLDGKASMLLYPPDGVSRPFKISSARPERHQLGFLHSKFIDRYDIEMPKKEKAEVGEPTTTFSAPAPAAPAQPRPAAPPAGSPFVQPTTTKVAEHPVETVAEPEAVTWEPYLGSRKEGDTGFDTDGKRFRCRPCFTEGKEVIFERTNQLAGHKATAHNGALWGKDSINKRVATAKENRRREAVEQHLRRMAHVMEIDWPSDRDIMKMRSTIERLEGQVASLTAERDEALEAATNPETGDPVLIAERDLALARAERAETKLADLRAALREDG